MYEQSKKKSNKHLDFSKMKGRIQQEHEEEKAMVKELLREEMDVELEDQLDLEVKDYRPHKPRTTAVTITDPKKDPRFKEVKRDGPTDRELTEEELKRREIAENPTAYGQKSAIINMEKMRGREEVDPQQKGKESEMIEGMIYGEVDAEDAVNVDRERSKAIEASKDRRLKPSSRTIDFDKQTSTRRQQEQEDRLADHFIQEEIDDGKTS